MDNTRITQIKNAWLIPAVIFTLAFALRFCFILFWHPGSLAGDEVEYDRLAQSLASHSGYVIDSGIPTAARPPGYPVFISLVYHFFGRNLLLVRLIQALLGSMSCILVYLLGRSLFGRNAGILASALSAVHLGFLVQPAKLLTEDLSILFLLCAVLSFDRMKYDYRRKRYYLLSGIFMGLAALTRSNLSILFLIFVLYLGFKLLLKRHLKPLVTAKYLFICCAAFVFTLAPWVIRNYLVFHEFIPLSTLQGIAIYTSYKPLGGKTYGFTPKDDVTLKANTMSSETGRSRYLTEETIKFISKNPSVFFRLLWLKLAYFFSPFDWELIRDRVVYNYLYGFYMPFFIMGFFLFRNRFADLAFNYLPVLGIIASCVVFFGIPRFRLVIEPYMIIFASAAMGHAYRNITNKKLLLSWLSAFFLLNFLFFLHSGRIIHASKKLLAASGCW